MPIYHFHSTDGERVPDREGTELPDDAAARVAAVRYAGAVLAHDPDELHDTGRWRIDVTDQDNRPLFSVTTVMEDAPAKSGG